MIKNVLFDLDNSLIKMDQDKFTVAYIDCITNKFVPLGYDEKNFRRGLIKGTIAMVNNDGKESNEKVFWKVFSSYNGDICYTQKDLFDKFYLEEYCNLKNITSPFLEANSVVKKLKEKSFNLILATNPVFPKVAQVLRIHWAMCDENDFSYITSYDNSSFCKPNVNYYVEIMKKLNLNPKESIMIGNDAKEDMIAEDIGLDTFLLLPGLINKYDVDIDKYKKGDLNDALNYLLNIC